MNGKKAKLIRRRIYGEFSPKKKEQEVVMVGIWLGEKKFSHTGDAVECRGLRRKYLRAKEECLEKAST